LRNLRTVLVAEIDLGLRLGKCGAFGGRSAAVAAAAGGADLGVGDLVGEQGVELGGLGGGVAQASADSFDGDASVDETVPPLPWMRTCSSSCWRSESSMSRPQTSAARPPHT
jgi:hypothetical protein